MKISRAQIEAVLRSYRPRPQQTDVHDRRRVTTFTTRFEESELVATVRRRAGDAPVLRGETVARLRELVSRNEYSVTADEIADLLLRRLIADRME